MDAINHWIEIAGVLALGYVTTVIAVVVLVKMFFPFTDSKSNVDRAITKTRAGRLRKVKLVNG